MLVDPGDHQHGWIDSLDPVRSMNAIDKVFAGIMGGGQFGDDKRVKQWFEQLPLVPVVTAVLLRQQNRRRWKPTMWIQMFARLPKLQEVHCEPWREWDDLIQSCTDRAFQLAFSVACF